MLGLRSGYRGRYCVRRGGGRHCHRVGHLVALASFHHTSRRGDSTPTAGGARQGAAQHVGTAPGPAGTPPVRPRTAHDHPPTPLRAGRCTECECLGNTGMGREEEAEAEQMALAATEERYLALPAEVQVRLQPPGPGGAPLIT